MKVSIPVLSTDIQVYAFVLLELSSSPSRPVWSLTQPLPDPYLSLTHPLPVPYPSLTCPLPVLTCLASLVPKKMLLLSGFEFSGVKNNFKNFENKKYIGLFSKILSKLTFSDDWRKIDGLVEQNLMEGSF